MFVKFFYILIQKKLYLNKAFTVYINNCATKSKIEINIKIISKRLVY